MDVRELTAAEGELVIDLWIDAGLTRPWNDPASDFARALALPCSVVLGAFAGDDLAGTVLVGDDGHRGWVYYLAVRDSYRRRGLGRTLMAAAEEWLRGRGVVKVNLMVRTSNDVALGFYERLEYGADEVTVLSRRLSQSSP